jgi:hypothetical protein
LLKSLQGVFSLGAGKGVGSHFRVSGISDPDLLAQEIIEELEAALEQFCEIAAEVGKARVAQRKRRKTIHAEDTRST